MEPEPTSEMDLSSSQTIDANLADLPRAMSVDAPDPDAAETLRKPTCRVDASYHWT